VTAGKHEHQLNLVYKIHVYVSLYNRDFELER